MTEKKKKFLLSLSISHNKNTMKFDEYDIRKKKEQLTGHAKTYKESLGNIYQWVKEDKLTPKQMEELTVHCYKHFIWSGAKLVSNDLLS